MVVSIDSSLVQAFKKNVKVKKGIKKAQKQIKQTKAEQRKTEKSNNNLTNEVKELKAKVGVNQSEDKSKSQQNDKDQVKLIEKVNDKTESKFQTQNKQPAKEELPTIKSKKKPQDKMELSDIGDVYEENKGTSLNKAMAMGSDIVSLLKKAVQENNQEETKHNPTKQQSHIINSFRDNTHEASENGSKNIVPSHHSITEKSI
jgi:hypothetical protein